MRLSTLVGRTLRQPPSDAQLISHQLLVRAGFVRGLEGSLFAYLPLGHCALERLESTIRRALVHLGGQEVSLPEAGAAEALADLARREIDSYRQLPALLFQAASRTFPSSGTRTGPFGAGERRQATLAVVGSAGLAEETKAVQQALERILTGCGLDAVWAEGPHTDRRAFYRHAAGDEEVVLCPACGYAAERSWATTSWPSAGGGSVGDPSLRSGQALRPSSPAEPELPREEIATPGCDTIAALAEFLQVPAARTLKMVFYSVDGQVTCVALRGDRSVDEIKLARLLGTRRTYASTEDELEGIGAVGGYASPIGLDPARVRVVADPSVRSGVNLVSGANRPGYHLRNVNIPRDFAPGEWADLALIQPGDPCPGCGTALEVSPAFALAHSRPPAPCPEPAEYLDADGRPRPLWAASWQIDLGRLLAATVEAHHDGYGIVWPAACAPFDVHLVGLDLRVEEVAAQAEAVYRRLRADGFAVLYDDRDASAGVKFNDADLIGVPLRLTVSKRWLTDRATEAKWRDSADRLKLDEAGLAAELARLQAGNGL